MTGSSPSSSTPKRQRVEKNLYQRRGGAFEAIYREPLTGRQVQRTLRATTLTDARKELRELLVKTEAGEQVAPSRITFAEVAAEYIEHLEALVRAAKMAPRTLERYRSILDLHLLPALGRLPIQKITPNHLAAFFRAKQDAGLSANTCHGMKSPLSRIFKRAVRRGYVARNPLEVLERDEIPTARNVRESRVLNREEITKLLDNAPAKYKPVIATAAFTGMRLMELLGLTWGDVDFEAGIIRIRYQLSRARVGEPAARVRLKTPAGNRDIRVEPSLAGLLKRHKLASRFSHDSDYVFSTETGRPMYFRNVATRGLDKAADDAGLNPEGIASLVMHDLRHTYGSHLIRQGMDVVRVSKQMGHKKPSITLDIYAREIEGRNHGEDITDTVTAAFGGIL